MSLSSTTSEVSYVGNNSDVTPYTVSFKFFLATDLVVTVTDENGENTVLVNVTDYVVTGGDPVAGATGSLVTVAAVPATSIVTIARTVSLTQPQVLTDLGPFPAPSVEHTQDRIVMMLQQIQRQIDFNTPLTTRVSEAFTVSSTSLVDVTGLVSEELAVNTRYRFRAFIISFPSDSAGAVYAVHVPGDAPDITAAITIYNTENGIFGNTGLILANDEGLAYSGPTNTLVTIEGEIRTGITDAGSLAIQFALATGTGGSVINAGSYLQIWKV